MNPEGGKQLFEEKICNSKSTFEKLSLEGFKFIIQLFNLVNENEKLIMVNRIEISRSKSYKSHSSMDYSRYGKNLVNKKLKDTLDEVVLNVHPKKLYGTEIFWRIMQNNNNKDVIEKARDFLNKLYTSLSSELESQALEIREVFIETYLEKLNGLLTSNTDKGQMITRMVSLMMDMIDESERKGTGLLKSHSALLEGELLEFIVENNVTSGIKKFPVEVYSNTTIWELKAELGKYVESSPICMKISVDNKELMDTDNGKTIGEFMNKRVGSIKLEKTNMDDVPKVSLLTEDKEMTDKVKEALKEIFEKFDKDGKMDGDAAALFTQTTTGESLVTKSDNRIKSLLANFGKEDGSYLDLEGFLNFYKNAIISNKEDIVRKNLAVYGYRNDLKKLNEVEEAVVDIKTLPRYILSYNPRSFELLFRILDKGDTHSGEQTWNLISRLTTNEEIYKKLAELKIKDKEWDKVIDVHSKYRLLYSLQIIESFLENENLNVGLSREQWQKEFVSKGGFGFLLSIFLNQDKEKGVCLALTKGLDKFEKECLGFIGRILNAFIRSAIYSSDGKLFEEVKKIQRKLVGESEPKIEETENKEGKAEEKDTAKKLQNELKELFKAKPSKIVFLKYSDTASSRAREIKSIEMDKEVAKSIITEAKPNEIWTRQIDLLESIIYEENINYVDSIIVTSALELFTSCVLINNEIFTLAKEYNKNNITFQTILIKGLLCEESQIIREKFSYTMGFLCYVIKDITTLQYVLNILLTYISKNNFNEGNNYGEYFMLIGKLIEAYYESVDKSELIDPKKFLPEFIEMLKNHHSLEKHNSSAEDKLLVGLIEIIRKILIHEPEIKDTVSISSGLLHEVFFNCLFPKYSSVSSEVLTAEGEIKDTQKCKSSKSRFAAYKLLSIMCSDNLKGQLYFVKNCLQPLCASIKPHSGWAYIPSSESRSKLGYAGLENLGCICYMLAMIQQFYMIPTFRYKLLAADDKREPIIDNAKKVDDNILHQLQRIFAYLELTERQDYKPDKFCFAFKDLEGMPTNISIQQDAQEFLNLIFDRLETLLANTPEKYLLQNVFGGKTCSQVICKGGCGQVRKKYEDFYNLSLSVKGNTTIYKALDNFIASDTISDVDCEHCAKKVNVERRTCLSHLPNILVVHLQRLLFNYDTMMNEKINSRLEFPKEFSIEPYTIEGIEAREKAVNMKNLPKDYFLHGNDAAYYEYKLVGVVVHYGTADAGHYYSYININRKRKKSNNL